MTTILSTKGLPRKDREQFWCQAMSDTFVPLAVGNLTEEPFDGFVSFNWIGRLMVAEIASTAQDIRRPQGLIGSSDAEYFHIAMIERGTGHVAQDGREAMLRPGDFAVYETTRPFQWMFGADWDGTLLTVPRGSVGLSEPESRRLTARRLDGRTGITGVVSRFLSDLGRNAEEVSWKQSERVLADVTDLVVTLLSDLVDDSAAVRSSLQRSLMFRIKAYIDCRLADPKLGPAEIASAVHISTRYLHKLFATEQRSVSQYIRRLRLDRCRADLLDPRFADQSISTIAFRWGFGDLSGFNRAFKAAFDTTPNDLRTILSVTTRR